MNFFILLSSPYNPNSYIRVILIKKLKKNGSKRSTVIFIMKKTVLFNAESQKSGRRELAGSGFCRPELLLSQETTT